MSVGPHTLGGAPQARNRDRASSSLGAAKILYGKSVRRPPRQALVYLLRRQTNPPQGLSTGLELVVQTPLIAEC